MAHDLGFLPTEQKEGFYFLSYSGEDVWRIKPLAMELSKRLKQIGLEMWYDYGIEYNNEGWEKQIEEKISNCKCLIVLASAKAFGNSECYIHTEMQLADEKTGYDKPVFGVLIDSRDEIRSAAREIKFLSACNKFLNLQHVDISNYRNPSGDIGDIKTAVDFMVKEIGNKLENIPVLNLETTKTQPEADSKSGDEYCELGRKYDSKGDYDNAFEMYLKAASLGNVEAMLWVGDCYYCELNGIKEKDYDVAIKWYEKAARTENDQGMLMLGCCYYEGCGTKQDYSAAFELFQKSAQKGNISAMNNLGECYLNGYGTHKSYFDAFTWYSRAYKGGNKHACYGLGCYYETVPHHRDYIKAYEWFSKAAYYGNCRAMVKLGEYYYEGKGVETNYAEAVKWYREPAIRGDESACYNLAICYFRGDGVEQSYERAIEWAKRGGEDGIRLIDDIEEMRSKR